eukprot:1141087-Pelagomonas_calceolata.AAC.7
MEKQQANANGTAADNDVLHLVLQGQQQLRPHDPVVQLCFFGLCREHQADTNGNNAEDATLRACAAQITALEAQMAESHAQLACALKALGIGQDAAVKDPEAAALKATVAADAAQALWGCSRKGPKAAALKATVAANAAQCKVGVDSRGRALWGCSRKGPKAAVLKTIVVADAAWCKVGVVKQRRHKTRREALKPENLLCISKAGGCGPLGTLTLGAQQLTTNSCAVLLVKCFSSIRSRSTGMMS